MRFFIFLSCMLVTSVFAQEQTLISGDLEIGGFGGPVVKLTQMVDDFGVLVGGRGGWIINHTITLGGGGYGLVNEIETVKISPDTTLYLNMGYGGLEIGYVHASDKLVHFTVQTLIGVGGISHSERNEFVKTNFEGDPDAFFVIEPSMDVVLNVTRYFRFAVGASYRYISGVDFSGIDDSDLNGLSAQITLKFGSF